MMPDTADEVLSIEIPMQFKRRGGKKMIVLPDTALPKPALQDSVNTTILKAIARAFRWQRLLEDGAYGCLDELAKAERMDPSRVSKLIRLTLLAPDVVQAIVDHRQPEHLMLQQLIAPFPLDWGEQRQYLGII